MNNIKLHSLWIGKRDKNIVMVDRVDQHREEVWLYYFPSIGSSFPISLAGFYKIYRPITTLSKLLYTDDQSINRALREMCNNYKEY